ncbi:MAG: hypothetical protein JWN29_1289 [Acidimicrobiales bacterium]|nr:hypothetical protein [Acidimicrobiales bacterium]
MPDVRELLHDSVDGAAAAPIAAIEARATRLRTRERRRHLVGTAAVVALVIAAIALVARNDGAEKHRVITRPPAPAPTPTPERVFPFTLGDVAIDGDDVWVADSTPVTGTVHRLDRSTLTETATIDLESVEDAHMIDVGPSGVWVGTAGYGEQITGGDVARIDPVTNRVTAHVDASGLGRWDPGDLVVTSDAVWVADALGRRLLRVDPDTAKVVATVPVFGGLSVGHGVLWVSGGDQTVALDAHTGRVLTEIPVVASAIAATDDGHVWLVTHGRLERYGTDGTRRTFGAVDELTRLAAVGTRVWLADSTGFRQLDQDGRLVPGTERASQALGGWEVTASGREVWRVDSAQTTRWRP